MGKWCNMLAVDVTVVFPVVFPVVSPFRPPPPLLLK
jgi:hypothetical protein